MFKLNIESSKDITELHINFADGTCTTIGNDNEQSRTTDTTISNDDGRKSNDGHTDSKHISKGNAKNNRKNLIDYGKDDNIDELEQEFQSITLPSTKRTDRKVNITDESKNGNF